MPPPCSRGRRHGTSAVGLEAPPRQGSHLQTLQLKALRDVVQAAANALLDLGRRLLGAVDAHRYLRPVGDRRHLRGATYVHLPGCILGLCRGEGTAEAGQRIAVRDETVLLAPGSPGNQFHEHARLRGLLQRHGDGSWVSTATRSRRWLKGPARPRAFLCPAQRMPGRVWQSRSLWRASCTLRGVLPQQLCKVLGERVVIVVNGFTLKNLSKLKKA